MTIRTEAVQHKTCSPYIFPLDPNRLEFQLRTGKEITSASLIINDPFLTGSGGRKDGWQGETVPMHLAGETRTHKIWMAVWKPPFRRAMYGFEISDGTESVMILEEGPVPVEHLQTAGERRQYFFYPWFFEEDAPEYPAWVKNTRWYQIFPDRFQKLDPTIEEEKLEDWNKLPEDGFEHYGGTLKGITDKLDYIRDLGCNGLYLNPIFLASYTNHKYNTTDYTEVDPDFGTREDLLTLIDEAHQRGMKIMLDGVFNHSGLDFAPWLDVCRNQENSRYKDWFMINEFPVDHSDRSQAAEGRYYSFAFESYMPKLNTANPELQDYLISIMEHWVRDWKIDGIRFDVANEVAHSFLKETRRRLEAINPDVYLMGEIWHDSTPWLLGDEFDAVMNYPFTFALENWWKNPEASSRILEEEIDRTLFMYPKRIQDAQFNLLDSHDTDRLLHRVNGDEDAFWQNLILLLSYPGSHCFYYGTEIAMDGGEDPDCRRTMPWDQIEEGLFEEETDTFKTLLQIQQDHPVLSSRNFIWKNPENSRLIHYEKAADPLEEHPSEEVLEIFLNAGSTPQTVEPAGKCLFSRKLSGNTLEPGGSLICLK